MRKVVDFLIRMSNILNILATKLQEITLREYFYVYVPNADKPRRIHLTFKSARIEAQRLAKKLTVFNEIQVLKIVYKTTGNNPPF